MDHKGTLSSAFNMSLGFIPVIISILLCEFITQDTAIYIGTGIGIVGIYLLLHRKGALIPNFILYIATGMLALLSLAALIPGDYVPPGALPLTLEVSILIPMLILYMHKKRFINHFLRQIGSCNKRLYAQGAEAAVVSARFALIFGILHFIIISIVVACQDPLSQTSMVILYKVFPPVVFVMSILFNQIAIRYFNHLMSHTEYVPIVNTKGEGQQSGEDFWVKAEKLYYTALIAYIWYEAPEEEQNFAMLIDMIDASEAREDDENFKNAVDLLFEELEEKDPNHFAVRQYKKYKLAAGKTAKSILISCGARLAPFDIKELRDLMEYDELELDTLGEEKTALFVIISDTDATFNFVVSIMYSQLFNLLCDKADDVYNGRLPVHVRMLLDEFANIGQIPQFEKLIATIRSREISASIILQSKSQLKAIYKDNADTIEGNCDTTLFLGGKEKTTLKELAEVLGKETIDLYNTSDTRGTSQSYGLNYQKTGKELMSQDEIAVMDGGKCIMQLRGVRPFFSDKFDITKHKRYRELSDYDQKNAFGIEKYVKHLHHMKVTPNTQVDEAFDCGEVNGQEEHSSNTTE